MKTRIIGYWTTTALVGLAFTAGGALDVMGGPDVQEILGHLGYPAYFAAIVGVWKILGAVAIVAPRFPRLKEWAYAGMFFDLSGAAISHAAVGDGASKVVTPLVLLVLVAVSWMLRPATRALESEKTLTAARGTKAIADATLAA